MVIVDAITHFIALKRVPQCNFTDNGTELIIKEKTTPELTQINHLKQCATQPKLESAQHFYIRLREQNK